jgi:hypothetical protein
MPATCERCVKLTVRGGPRPSAEQIELVAARLPQRLALAARTQAAHRRDGAPIPRPAGIVVRWEPSSAPQRVRVLLLAPLARPLGHTVRAAPSGAVLDVTAIPDLQEISWVLSSSS